MKWYHRITSIWLLWTFRHKVVFPSSRSYMSRIVDIRVLDIRVLEHGTQWLPLIETILFESVCTIVFHRGAKTQSRTNPRLRNDFFETMSLARFLFLICSLNSWCSGLEQWVFLCPNLLIAVHAFPSCVGTVVGSVIRESTTKTCLFWSLLIARTKKRTSRSWPSWWLFGTTTFCMTKY